MRCVSHSLAIAAIILAAVKLEAFMVSRSPNNGVFSLRKKCALLGAYCLSNGRLEPSILSRTGLGTQQRRADFDDMLLSRQIIVDDLECRTSLSLAVTLTDRPGSRRVFAEARNTMSCLPSKADHKWISILAFRSRDNSPPPASNLMLQVAIPTTMPTMPCSV
jgi:hypothetical protein